MVVTLEELLGKTMLIGITYYAHDGQPVEQKQFWGVVESADEDSGIKIRQTNGNVFTMPPDLSSTEPAAPGEYRLRSTGEVVRDPDYLSVWNIVRPAEHAG